MNIRSIIFNLILMTYLSAVSTYAAHIHRGHVIITKGETGCGSWISLSLSSRGIANNFTYLFEFLLLQKNVVVVIEDNL